MIARHMMANHPSGMLRAPYSTPAMPASAAALRMRLMAQAKPHSVVESGEGGDETEDKHDGARYASRLKYPFAHGFDVISTGEVRNGAVA